MLHILWIGSNRCEFSSVVFSIEQSSHLRRVAALAEVRDMAPPDVVVLAQARPGEFQESKIAELRDKWNQTQFIYVLGAWCCGLKRVCDEFSMVPTVYAHACDYTKIRTIVGGQFQLKEAVSSPTPQAAGLVVVYSPVACYRAALADALAQFGMKTIEGEIGRTMRSQGVDFVVWDTPADFDLREQERQVIVKRHPGAQIVALLTDPREFELEPQNLHVIRSIPQPFELRDLVRAIQSSTQWVPSAA